MGSSRSSTTLRQNLYLPTSHIPILPRFTSSGVCLALKTKARPALHPRSGLASWTPRRLEASPIYRQRQNKDHRSRKAMRGASNFSVSAKCSFILKQNGTSDGSLRHVCSPCSGRVERGIRQARPLHHAPPVAQHVRTGSRGRTVARPAFEGHAELGPGPFSSTCPCGPPCSLLPMPADSSPHPSAGLRARASHRAGASAVRAAPALALLQQGWSMDAPCTSHLSFACLTPFRLPPTARSRSRACRTSAATRRRPCPRACRVRASREPVRTGWSGAMRRSGVAGGRKWRLGVDSRATGCLEGLALLSPRVLRRPSRAEARWRSQSSALQD